jgi:hypothetical protein
MVAFSRSTGFVRVSVAVALLAAGAMGLTACTPTSHASSTTKPTISTPQASSTPTPAPKPTTAPVAVGTPVTLTCDQIVTPAQVYAFNPNFGADPGYAPAAGSLPATIKADRGVACAWLNQTSGDVVQIAIGEPPASTMTSLKNTAVTTSQAVPTYGIPPQVEGYFTMRGSNGEAQVFTGKYWIVGISGAFQEPGDAAQLMQNILQNLPAS